MIIIPKIPENVQEAPLQRAFGLSTATTDALSAYGPQVAIFLNAYLKSWVAYKREWNYEDGMIWLGALSLFDATHDDALLNFVRHETAARIAPNGAMLTFVSEEYNIDNIQAGCVLPLLFDLTGDERYRQAMDVQFEQLKTHPRTKSGNYWHKQIYPHQVWLDGLYMAQPYQTAYARITGQPELFADTVHQFLAVETHLKSAQTGLYYHGWDESKTERWADPVTGCSACSWGRAMGWWVMALVDVYAESQGMAGREVIARLLSESLAALLRVRSEHGLWYQIVDQGERAGNYEEISCSLMIAYALMKAQRLGVSVGQDGYKAGLQALMSVCKTYVTPSSLNGICGVAGLGNTPYRDGSYAYYLSEKLTPNDPKGVGVLMLALSEALRLP